MDPSGTTRPPSTAWRTATFAVAVICALGVALQIAAVVQARAALDASAIGGVVTPALERNAWLALAAMAVSTLGLLALTSTGALALGAALANLAAANARAVRASVHLAVSEARCSALEEEALGADGAERRSGQDEGKEQGC